MTPPAAPLAPVPRRKTTLFAPESYSAWSSRAASVFVPALAPLAISSDPGTKVTPAGRGSVSTTWAASSWPVLVVAIVYSRTSPGRTVPPFRSATLFDSVAARFGANTSVMKTTTPG